MKNILRHLIERQPDQCINYEQYMNTVLYHQEKGYYHKASVKIGKSGDFYTSPAVHPVFGRTLARFFIDFIREQSLPPVVCEVGAGDGRLAKAILDEWQRLSPDSYREVVYRAVEESPFHRTEQKKRLPAEYPFVQYESLDQLQEAIPAFSGILFSNELFDAFPVRVVQNAAGELHEVKITLDQKDELTEVLEPCGDEKIKNWLDSYGVPLKNGQRIEIPLAMTQWLENALDWLKQGMILTIDYGYTDKEWGAPARRDGSLRGYRAHRLISDPLYYPGEMDLTSHVSVDAVRKIAESSGFEPLFSVSQREFLLKSGILGYLTAPAGTDPFSDDYRQNRAIRSLIAEGSLGNAFYVMAQGRSMNNNEFIHEWLSRDPIQKAMKKRR